MKFVRSVLYTLAFVSFALAQTAKPVISTNAVPVKNQSNIKVTQETNEKHMTGMLVSVDNQKQTFVIQLKSKTYPFLINASTKIEGNDGNISFNDLKPGNAISVQYIRNPDSRTALSISQSLASLSSSKVTQKANTSTTASNAKSNISSVKVDSLTEVTESKSKIIKTVNVVPPAEKAKATPTAEKAKATPTAEKAKATPAAEKAKATPAAEKAKAAPAAETKAAPATGKASMATTASTNEVSDKK